MEYYVRYWTFLLGHRSNHHCHSSPEQEMFPPFLQLQSPSLELGPPKYFHFQEFLFFLNYKHLVVLSLVLEASLEASFSRSTYFSSKPFTSCCPWS